MSKYDINYDSNFREAILKLCNILRCRPFIFKDELGIYKPTIIRKVFSKLFDEDIVILNKSNFRQLLIDVAYKGFPLPIDLNYNKGRELLFSYINGHSIREIGKLEGLSSDIVRKLIFSYCNHITLHKVEKAEEELITEKLIQVYRSIKRVPAIHVYYKFQVRNKDLPTIFDIIKVFGSYGNALSTIFGKGSPVVIKTLCRDIDIKYVENILKTLKDIHSKKNKVILTDLDKSMKSKVMVIFGSFKNALRESGLANNRYYYKQ